MYVVIELCTDYPSIELYLLGLIYGIDIRRRSGGDGWGVGGG